jgi:2-succinyl-5-enolpyruvyl-6-hydroxy-3-cyclohexene-1-carboxylate synthase
VEGIKPKIKTDENLDGFVNLEWAETITKELIKQGVRHFCIAYGNRSTPLVLAAAHHPLAKTHTHFDERGLGFYALGIAKAINEPVAIIVTSGTALGNLYPAVMEAHHSQIPLILLTADRPDELQETCANQTCKQQNFFGHFTRFSFDLPTPDAYHNNLFLQSTVAQLVHRSLYPIKGPVQLNCPFREPFLDSNTNGQFNIPYATQYVTPKNQLHPEDFSYLFEQIDLYDEGMILVGQQEDPIDLQSIVNLSKHLNFPVFAEIHSNIRINEIDSLIPFPVLTLRHGKKLQCDEPKVLIVIGEKFISKEFLTLMQSTTVECIVQISTYPFKSDPTHRVNFRVVADIQEFSKIACDSLQKKPLSSYFQKWSLGAKKIISSIETVLDRTENLSEPLISLLLTNFTEYEVSFFVSNSMPIRHMNDFYHAKSHRSFIFTNRGLSGIDGNIATAIGLQKGLETPLIAIVGDLATLHDLNSFKLLEPTQKILFLILNNNGGSIFTKVSNHQPKEILDKFFVGKHDLRFSKIAEMFNINYLQVDSLDAFSFGLGQFIDQKGPMILEVLIDNHESDQFTKAIDKEISQIHTQSSTIKSYFFG